MRIKQRVWHHLPYSPPAKGVLLQNCKHCYQVFINNKLDELTQIFSCFSTMQATDIQWVWQVNVIRNPFNTSFKLFLNTAPASPCTPNTQIPLKEEDERSGRDWHTHSFTVLLSDCNCIFNSNFLSHSHLHYSSSRVIPATPHCRVAEKQWGACSSNTLVVSATQNTVTATNPHLTQGRSSQAKRNMPLFHQAPTLIWFSVTQHIQDCNVTCNRTRCSLKPETIGLEVTSKSFFFFFTRTKQKKDLTVVPQA